VRPTLPAWRRARERTTLTLRVAGEVPAEAQALGATSAPAEAPTLLLIDAAHVVLATGTGEAATGIWSSHPALVAAARLALGAAGAPVAPGAGPAP
jgi:hypothetical protein